MHVTDLSLLSVLEIIKTNVHLRIAMYHAIADSATIINSIGQELKTRSSSPINYQRPAEPTYDDTDRLGAIIPHGCPVPQPGHP